MIRIATSITLGVLLSAAGCKGEQPDSDAKAPPAKSTSTDAAATETEAAAEPAATADPKPLDRLLTYLPTDAQRVAYDRLSKRFKVDTLEVVFAIPPQAADLLDERTVLDEALDITLDGDAEPENWLSSTTLAFLLPLGKTPYFLRPLSKPASEVGLLLEQSFTKSTIEGVDVWLPTGSFPWRIALLEGDVAAFLPVDTVGNGLEPLLAAREAEASPLETELSRSLAQDGAIELLLFAVGPLVHYDVSAPIAQVDFLLRRSGDTYQGQVTLRPNGDLDEALEQLRTRKHPEENQQVQALIGELELATEQNLVIGQLALTPDRLKHFLES
jgi:hypothetical protein